MTTTDTGVQTDLKSAIQTIAQANNIIIENDEKIKAQKLELDKLNTDIAALEVNKTSLTKENNETYDEIQKHKKALEDTKSTESTQISEERKQLDADKAAWEEEKAKIVDAKKEAEATLNEAQRLDNQNKELTAQIDAKIKESKELSSSRNGQIAEAKALIERQQVERAQLDNLKKEIEDTHTKNAEQLKKIEVATKDAEYMHEVLQEERKKSESTRAQVLQENADLAWLKGQQQNMEVVLRQTLKTVIELNGTIPKIEGFTDETRIIAAKALLSEAGIEVPEDLWRPIQENENAELDDVGKLHVYHEEIKSMRKPQLIEELKKLEIEFSEETTAPEMKDLIIKA